MFNLMYLHCFYVVSILDLEKLWTNPVSPICLLPKGDSYITHCWTPRCITNGCCTAFIGNSEYRHLERSQRVSLVLSQNAKRLMDGCLEGLGESAVAGCDRVQGIGARLAVLCDRVKLLKCCSRKASDLSCALCCIWERGSDFYTVHWGHPSSEEESLFLMLPD